ncbi:hypothetical protein E2C01_056283 [Portunus trituberculatus]|uniref:Uncharacterized protein n=1 Tax=Portunus trituberculatus TaxID=210409 RepID=A0A5B7GQ02_PORTR|nr:hypothetical protein [Portunus trituberculatus]
METGTGKSLVLFDIPNGVDEVITACLASGLASGHIIHRPPPLSTASFSPHSLSHSAETAARLNTAVNLPCRHRRHCQLLLAILFMVFIAATPCLLCLSRPSLSILCFIKGLSAATCFYSVSFG